MLGWLVLVWNNKPVAKHFFKKRVKISKQCVGDNRFPYSIVNVNPPINTFRSFDNRMFPFGSPIYNAFTII